MKPKPRQSNWIKGDPHQAFRRGRVNARRRGHAWELTEPEFKKLFTKPCAYCRFRFHRGWGTGLDQKIAGAGYTILNVVPCCASCNHVKSDVYTYDEMLEIGLVLGPLLRKLRKRKKK